MSKSRFGSAPERKFRQSIEVTPIQDRSNHFAVRHEGRLCGTIRYVDGEYEHSTGFGRGVETPMFIGPFKTRADAAYACVIDSNAAAKARSRKPVPKRGW